MTSGRAFPFYTPPPRLSRKKMLQLTRTLGEQVLVAMVSGPVLAS